ncbi:MAG: FliM/FliN family flagellar motor switch protein [Spirochaetota bacterium]
MKLGRIKDVKVPLEVVLGHGEASVEQMSSLGPGTIVELAALAGEPVELRAGGELVAWGEVVVIDESFGLRVTRLAHDEQKGA